jgi:hypothetical protein
VLREEAAVRLCHLAHEDRGYAVGKRERDVATVREELRGRPDTVPHERVGEVEPGDPDSELL